MVSVALPPLQLLEELWTRMLPSSKGCHAVHPPRFRPSLKVLCELRGWKAAKTVLRRDQQPDEVQLKQAILSRPRPPAPMP